MIAKNTTIQDLYKTLENVNKKYDGNVIFNREPEPYGRQIRFTLRVKNSREPGHRIGFCLTSLGNHRRLVSACWHVHGNFFEELFEICPEAIIKTNGKDISIYGGNWEDRNIGSMMEPMYFSEACECE